MAGYSLVRGDYNGSSKRGLQIAKQGDADHSIERSESNAFQLTGFSLTL
jgi:hypothetical protein